MKDKNSEKIKIILLGVIATILLCLLVIVSLNFKNINKYKSETNNTDKTTNEKTESTTKKENVIPNEKDDNPTTNNSNSNSSIEKNESNSNIPDNNNITTNQNSGTNQNPNTNQETVTNQESDVVAYFEGLERNIDSHKNSNDETYREKIKNGFITIVDFLFYDSTIKGYTFSELTNEAKIKVLTLALKIDNKIDKYFPNYKNNIKNKMNNFKEKVAIIYLETTSKLCEKVGESSCKIARENFREMKESFGFTWENIKNVATDSYSSLTKILKEWYQSIKN